MDYKVNILVHVLHRSNFGWSVTYMSKEEPNWGFHGHLARFSYIYDIYDTNDGDSMKAKWHKSDMNADIWNIRSK